MFLIIYLAIIAIDMHHTVSTLHIAKTFLFINYYF